MAFFQVLAPDKAHDENWRLKYEVQWSQMSVDACRSYCRLGNKARGAAVEGIRTWGGRMQGKERGEISMPDKRTPDPRESRVASRGIRVHY